MEQTTQTDLKLKVSPCNLGATNIYDLVSEEYTNTIQKGFYIKKVLNASVSSNGKIMSDGSIVYIVHCELTVLNPELNHRYLVNITGSNKMGAVHRNELVAIFIPKSYCVNDVLTDEETSGRTSLTNELKVTSHVLVKSLTSKILSTQTTLDTILDVHLFLCTCKFLNRSFVYLPLLLLFVLRNPGFLSVSHILQILISLS